MAGCELSQPVATDPSALIAERRRNFGPDFVPGRIGPEAQARALLDEAAGAMTRIKRSALAPCLTNTSRATRSGTTAFAPGHSYQPSHVSVGGGRIITVQLDVSALAG